MTETNSPKPETNAAQGDTPAIAGAWVIKSTAGRYLARDKHGQLVWYHKPDAVLGDTDAGTGDTATTLTFDTRDEAIEFAATSESPMVQQGWRSVEQLP